MTTTFDFVARNREPLWKRRRASTPDLEQVSQRGIVPPPSTEREGRRAGAALNGEHKRRKWRKEEREVGAMKWVRSVGESEEVVQWEDSERGQ